MNFMMDDVLDNWNTARIKSLIQNEEKEADSNAPALNKKNKKKMVCSFFPSPSCCFRPVANLSLRSKFGHNIEKLKETLDKILKDKVTYGFDFTARQITVEVERPKTISEDVDLYDISSCRTQMNYSKTY